MDRINNALYHHMYFVPGGDRMEIIVPLAALLVSHAANGKTLPRCWFCAFLAR
jgi:hypothetical protein